MSNVLAHEIGHCLGLLHPHEEHICKEAVNGSNCLSCGDLICDTPADPFLRKNAEVSDAPSCVYSSSNTVRDFNGGTYNPDTRNIMSYTHPGCMTHFTAEQGQRMRTFLASRQELIDLCMPDNIALLGHPWFGGFFFGNAWYKALGQIYNPGNAHFLSGSHTEMRAGDALVLNSGFMADVGSYLNLGIDTLSCSSVARITSLRSSTDGLDIDYSFIDELDAMSVFNILESQIQLYPNPATHQVRLVLPLGLSGKLDLDWYNSLGQVLRSDYLEVNVEGVDLSLEDLMPGLYHLHLRQGQATWIGRLRVQ